MFTYAERARSRSALAPTDDIVTAIVNAEVDGEQLVELEFDMFFMLLTVAGNETTRNAITHGMLAFLEHPDQWERLRDDPALIRPRGRRDRALGEPGHLLPALGHARHRAARPADQGGRQDHRLVPVGEPRRGRLRATRSTSTSVATPTPTSASAAAARTSVSAPTSPGWRSRRIYDELTRRMPDIARGRARPPALQLHQRDQAPPREVVDHRLIPRG